MSAAAAIGIVRRPAWLLTYKGVNVTGRIARMVTSVAYTSHAGGVGNDLELEIEDADKRWQEPWFPARGDVVNLQIGYDGETLAPCGDFQVDELELSGPPDVMHVRCLAAFITPAMRTPNTLGHENETLLGIATKIAAKYGFAVSGAPEAINVQFQRVTQRQETDLAFLRRLALAHNYDFNVRGKLLVFYSRTQIEAKPAAITIPRTGTVRFSFKTRSHQIYKAATVSYQDPATKKLITATVAANPAVPAGDTLKIPERCENGQMATLKAQSALHQRNMFQETGTLTVPGNVALAAGNNISVSGFGAFDGKYHIQTAKHRLTRAEGYVTEIEVRNVQ